MGGSRRSTENAARTQTGALLTDTTIIYLLRVSAAFIAYVTQILLARWMGAAELGNFVYALSWLWILSIFASLGLPAAAQRFIPQSIAASDRGRVKGYVRKGRQITGGFGVVVGATAVGTTLLIDHQVASIGNTDPLILGFLAIPLATIVSLHKAVARAHLWFFFASLMDTFLRPFLLLLAVVAAALSGVVLSATSVMMLLVAVLLIIIVGQFIVLERRLNRELGDVQPVYDTCLWLRSAIPLLFVVGFVSYAADVNIIVVGLYLTPEEIAVYNAALRTVGMITFGLSAVGIIVAPRASRYYAKGDMAALQRFIARATQLMFWPSVAAFLGLVIFGEHVLALFGERFVAGYETLLILASAQLLISAVGPVTSLLSVTGHQDRCLLVIACALVAMLALNTLLVPRFGIEGGATSVLLVTALWTVWFHRLVVRHVGIEPSIFSLRWAFR